jgi:hypothetical protein
MRRKVFETLPGPDWFWYPKRVDAKEHRKSEDVAFSEIAQAAGFKLGSTSKVTTGHYNPDRLRDASRLAEGEPAS